MATNLSDLDIRSLIDVETEKEDNKETLYHLEAEQAILGAIIYNNNVYEKVSDFLKPFHFAERAHQKIYEIITSLIDRGQVADILTIKQYVLEELKAINNTEYLEQLYDGVISLGNVGDYGKIIYELYLRRELISIAEEISSEAKKCDIDISVVSQIEDAEKRIFDLTTDGSSGQYMKSLSLAINESIKMADVAFKRDSHVVGITTGFKDLDKWLGGLHRSDLLILAGRPSMGKTALATNIAFNAANALKQQGGGTVAFFSLEMSAEQLATRLLSQESGIPSDRIRRGELKQDDFPKFINVSQKIANIPFFIDDTPALTVSGLRTRARRLKKLHDLDLIVIDYLQLLNNNSRNDSRVQEISEITRALKALAKELSVPVVALSQLSRAVEQRDDKKPQLADLRESGSIEQDSDVVMFVYREEYYLARKQPNPGSDKYLEWQASMEKVHNKAEIIIAKQRHGPIGIIPLYYNANLTKFGNLDQSHGS